MHPLPVPRSGSSTIGAGYAVLDTGTMHRLATSTATTTCLPPWPATRWSAMAGSRSAYGDERVLARPSCLSRKRNDGCATTVVLGLAFVFGGVRHDADGFQLTLTFGYGGPLTASPGGAASQGLPALGPPKGTGLPLALSASFRSQLPTMVPGCRVAPTPPGPPARPASIEGPRRRYRAHSDLPHPPHGRGGSAAHGL